MKIKKCKKKKCGFTLVELVLVITIVVILSVISGPIYKSYAYKARQAEGYVLLGTIRSAQENYRGEYNSFIIGTACTGTKGIYETCNDNVLKIDARPNKYYTSFCVGAYGTNDYSFTAIAYSAEVGNLKMIYNRTTGVTM